MANEVWDAEKRELVPAPMLGDADENAWMADEEKEPEEEHTPEYPCEDDMLWRGVFGQVADMVEKRSWEVWLGTACAIGARASRNIHTFYHGNMYGWLYGLLIAPTGAGKSVCTDICEALLPADYHINTSVQSGPGLVPILGESVRNAKGKVTSVIPQPAILVLPEWTALVKNLKIQNATLSQDLNTLFDGKDRLTISRSDSNKTGGGRLEIPTPSLSICATTTESMFHEEVTASMIRSGFLNRYLILPGSHTRWKFEDPTAGVNYGNLRDIFPRGQPHAFGLGQSMWDMYTPEGRGYVRWYGDPLFEGLMNTNGNGNNTSDVYKRLHTYAHKIALIYAWADRAPLITQDHAMAAQVVIETSLAYLRQLIDDTPPELSFQQKTKKTLEELICTQVGQLGTAPKRGIVKRLQRKWGYSTVSDAVESLVKSGALVAVAKSRQGNVAELKVAF